MIAVCHTVAAVGNSYCSGWNLLHMIVVGQTVAAVCNTVIVVGGICSI